MLRISRLFIYPVKSLGGIEVDHVRLCERGFQLDRRWMLTDLDNRFMTLRECPQLALFGTRINDRTLMIYRKQDPADQLELGLDQTAGVPLTVDIWNEDCQALPVGKMADQWFSQRLGRQVRLVFMPDTSRRLVDPVYAGQQEITAFSDGYPLLLIGQSSLDELNRRLPQPITMERFRPNLVFTGAPPFGEDQLRHFRIGDIDFFCVKPCARCVVTTLDPDTGESSPEPLKTLATFRQFGHKIHFGQNLLFRGQGDLTVGDALIPIDFDNTSDSPLSKSE